MAFFYRFFGCITKFLFADDALRILAISVSLVFGFSFSIKAQVEITEQPAASSNCHPVGTTSYPISLSFKRGSCGNLSTSNITVVWQFSADNSTWSNVANDLPSGYSYGNVNSNGGGNGANTIIVNTLNITISSSGSSGQYYYRAVVTGPSCPSKTSNSAGFLIKPLPTPSFTAQPGAAGCINTDYTYTTEAGQEGYLWSIPGIENTDYTLVSGSLTSNSITLKWLTAGGKTVTVNYSTDGCTAATATSSTETLVATPPVPTFTAQAPPDICAHTDVIYTTQSGFLNYTWSFSGTPGIDYSIISGGTTSSNTVTLKWITEGNKTVDINYSDSNGCTAADPASATTSVNPRPAVTFTAFADANSCANTNVTYTTQSGQFSYVWSLSGTQGTDYTIVSGGTGSGDNSVTLQWLTLGTKTVTVNYINGNGCDAVSPATSNTSVDVAAIPVISASGPLSFCDGGSVILNSTSASSYQWFKDGIPVTGAVDQSYTAVSSGTYAVQILNTAGCEATSAGTIVTEYPLPDITVSSQAASLCFSAAEQTSTLEYTNTEGLPTTYSIIWSNAASSAGFADVSDQSLPPGSIPVTVPRGAAGNTTYFGTLTVKNGNGCLSPAKTFSVSITSPPVVSSFNLSASSGCAGTGAVISITSTSIVNGTYTVTYDLNGANNSSGATAKMIFNNGAGTFLAEALNAGNTNITVTQIALVGCATPVTIDNTASFLINSLPSVAPIAGPVTVCAGNTITLENATTGGVWSTSEPTIATVNSSGVVTGLLPGDVVITYTTSPDPLTGCTNSVTSELEVFALPPIELIIGSTVLCLNTKSLLNNATAGGTWSSTVPAVATIDSTGLVTTLSEGTTIIMYTTAVNADGCTNSTTVELKVEPPPVVTPGPELEVCQSATPSAIALSGASFGGSATSATWAIVAGGGTLSNTGPTSDPADVTYTPAANFSGTVTLSLTSAAPNSCTPASEQRVINISAKPIVVAGEEITVCQSASPGAILLSGASISGGATTCAWYISDGGGTLSNDTQTADPASVSYTPSANFTGIVTLNLTSNANGSCPAVIATRTINVAPPPTAFAGNDINICGDAGVINITGGSTASNYSSVSWETSGNGTFTNPTSLTIATYTPSSDDIAAGSVTITLRASGGTCLDATSSKILNITKAALAVSGSDISVCFNPGPVNITAGASAADYSSILWTSDGTGTISDPASLTNAAYTPGAGEVGTITLTLTATGNSPCSNVVATKSLIINPDAVISLTSEISTSSQTVCINTAITPIVYSISGGGTAATFSGLPNGVTGSFSSGVATISGTPTVAGSFNYMITTTGTCVQTSATGTLTVNPVTVGGTLSPSQATGCAGTASGTIELTGHTGSILRWEFSIDAGNTWAPISNTSSSLSYSNLNQTTLYRAVLRSGTCGPEVFSTVSIIVVDPAFTPVITADPETACVGQPVTLTASGYESLGILSGGNFNDANPPGWSGSNASNNNAEPNSPWGEANGPKVFNGVTYNSTGKFMIVTGTTGLAGNTSVLTTPLFSTVGMSSASLTWRQAYNLNAGTTAKVEISLDGGTTYHTLQTYVGPANLGPTDGLTAASINLNAYLGRTDLKVRFHYTGSEGSNWAIDDVNMTGPYTSLTYTWTSPDGTTSSGSTLTVTPTTSGTQNYTVSTTTSSNCPGAGIGTIALIVNPAATLGGVSVAPACSGSNMTVILSGVLPGSTSSVTYKIGTNANVTITGVVADASGVASFQVLSDFANDGQTFSIVSISSALGTNASCSMVPTTNNSTLLSISNGFIWTGAAIPDNNWSNPANWTACGVPTNGSSVTIPQVGNGNFPKMDVNFASNNFDLQGAATLDINGTLFQLGNSTTSAIANAGSFIGSATSRLVIYGALNSPLKFSQTDTGSSNALLSFSINVVGKVTLGNPLWVIGNVLPNSGELASEGNLTMVSSATTSSNISAISVGADVTGSVNVQSYITGGSSAMRGFRSMSSPIDDSKVTGDKTYRQLKDYTVVTGPGGVTNGFDQGGEAQPYAETISFYEEAIAAGLPSFMPLTTISAANIPGTGFYLFFRGSQGGSYEANYTKVNSPYAVPESVTVTYKGPINKFNITPVVLKNSFNENDASNGYNLVGNPYPSAIDWDFVTRSTDVLNTVIIYKPGGTQASYIDGVSNNGGGPTIQPGQGFYVRTSVDGATISFKENSKSSVYPPRFLATPENMLMSANPKVLIKNIEKRVLRLNIQDGINKDETTIVFQPGALLTAGYEDVTYLFGGSVNLASLSSDNKNLAINFLPEIDQIAEVRLNVNSAKSGDMKLAFTDLSQTEGYQVFLKDALFPDQLRDVKPNPVYNLNIDKAKAETFGNKRFSIIFKKETFKKLALNNFLVKKLKDGVELGWTASETEKIKYFDVQHSLDGKSFNTLGTVDITQVSGRRLYFLDKEPALKMNYYRIKAVQMNHELSLSEIKSINYSLPTVNAKQSSLTVYPNPAMDKIDLKVDIQENAPTGLKVFNLNGIVVLDMRFADMNDMHADISRLNAGVYVLELRNSSTTKLLGRTRLVKVH